MKLKLKYEAGQLTVLRDGQVIQPTASKVGIEKKATLPSLIVLLYRDGIEGMGQLTFECPEWELEALVPPPVENLVSAHLPV